MASNAVVYDITNLKDVMKRYTVYGSYEHRSKTKLTDDQIREIRASARTGEQLAKKYKVNRSTISKIRRGVLRGDVK